MLLELEGATVELLRLGRQPAHGQESTNCLNLGRLDLRARRGFPATFPWLVGRGPGPRLDPAWPDDRQSSHASSTQRPSATGNAPPGTGRPRGAGATQTAGTSATIVRARLLAADHHDPWIWRELPTGKGARSPAHPHAEEGWPRRSQLVNPRGPRQGPGDPHRGGRLWGLGPGSGNGPAAASALSVGAPERAGKPYQTSTPAF